MQNTRNQCTVFKEQAQRHTSLGDIKSESELMVSLGEKPRGGACRGNRKGRGGQWVLEGEGSNRYTAE